MKYRCYLFATVLLLPGFVKAASAPCMDTTVLYMPVETITEQLQLRGETRAQYLDRQYGAGRWQPDSNGVVAVTPASNQNDADLQIGFHPKEGDFIERVDVTVESRLNYIDDSGRETLIYGHRELASYAIVSGTTAHLDVPGKVFQEPGALLVAVVLAGRGAPGEPAVLVHGQLVSVGSCERHVYTADRFTAIRLNRSRDK